MKYFAITAFALVATSAAAMADDLAAGCNPLVANWQNAAPFTCAKSDASGDKFKRHEVEEVSEEPAPASAS